MDDERVDSNDREYSNGEIVVYWKPSKCTHATTCYRELIEVFNPRKRPWVNMEGATTDEIIKVVDLCPTEALSYKRINKKLADNSNKLPDEQPIANTDSPAAEIRIMKDGPLIVKGNFIIRDSNNNELRQMKMASFCRCGHSCKMPFCDGAHRKFGFVSD